jgi:hypothetical protein
MINHAYTSSMENDSVAQSEAKNVRGHLVIWLTLSATCVLTYYNLLSRPRPSKVDRASRADIAFEDDKVAQILELPKHVKPVGIICLGYPAETPEKLSRIDISKLVHFEKW